MSGVREVVVRADGRAWGALLGLPAEARAGGRGAPVVCVAHGFAQTADRYLSLIESLAGRGYVVVAPHASAHLLPSHSRYARQLRDSLLWACRTQPVADPSACALVGHSLGGGAAVLAAGLLAGSSRPRGSDVRLRAVVGLAPARTRPSSVAVAASGSLGALPGLVVVGYSRGTVPARHAALEHAAQVRGLSLVAPTWFQGEVRPRELATKGLAEGARGILRESWVDKWGLIAASARLAQEMVAHPIALRNDVAAIAEEGATDLHQVLAAGIRVGVVAGRNDELCEVGGIRRVIDEPEIRGRVDYREAESDHFCYFLKPAPLRVVADQIGRLAIPTT